MRRKVINKRKARFQGQNFMVKILHLAKSSFYLFFLFYSGLSLVIFFFVFLIFHSFFRSKDLNACDLPVPVSGLHCGRLS